MVGICLPREPNITHRRKDDQEPVKNTLALIRQTTRPVSREEIEMIITIAIVIPDEPDCKKCDYRKYKNPGGYCSVFRCPVSDDKPCLMCKSKRPDSTGKEA